jgi:hypothetical protein
LETPITADAPPIAADKCLMDGIVPNREVVGPVRSAIDHDIIGGNRRGIGGNRRFQRLTIG